VPMPRSRTPAGTPHQASTVQRYCLPVFRHRRHPQCRGFRGSITQPGHSLSTLHHSSYPLQRKTRFRLVANLYRAGSTARWVPLAISWPPPCHQSQATRLRLALLKVHPTRPSRLTSLPQESAINCGKAGNTGSRAGCWRWRRPGPCRRWRHRPIAGLRPRRRRWVRPDPAVAAARRSAPGAPA